MYKIPFDFSLQKVEFLHRGKRVIMQNPSVHIYLNSPSIAYEYKVEGENNGFFFGAIDMRKQVVSDTDIKIPDEIFRVLVKEQEQIAEINRDILVNQDFKYTVHDTSSYGIYNGISEFDLTEIVDDIKNKLGCRPLIYAGDVYRTLTDDPDIQRIAEETYVPYPASASWTDEYKAIHAEEVASRTAHGYGTIPNRVMRGKLEEIILRHHAEDMKKEENIRNIFEEAKRTGERHALEKWSRDVDEEDNSIVFYTKYAMPDGSVQVVENRGY